ncbi:hypothetical protein [Streptomyces sp. URMC 124]|uniref:hypothetical protein n=1 Tax=Streptomyces sp. URMC 124 TaxID=3423405 RepID=UPI003F19C231
MSHINWEDSFCGDSSNCFRIGTDAAGNAYIAVSGSEDRYITDTRDALRALIRGIKAGEADHLL